MKPKLGSAKTQLFLIFLEETMTEPTTNETYSSLVKNLTKIKPFASGIVVPKDYIWPTDEGRILQPATSIVLDAHKLGLQVFAYGFANDNYLSYNYSFDPAREYQQFIRNSNFSVDGLISEFPSTASEAIGCLPHSKNALRQIETQLESFFDDDLARNPLNKNSGKIVTLVEFLKLAKKKAVPGVLIIIKNAAYLAKRGLDIVGTVETALKNATLNNQKVLIESDDTSVLLKFKDKLSYQRVLYINEQISSVSKAVAREIKKYADAVFVHRDAIVVSSENFVLNFTKTISSLHAANISVYVGFLKNEFQNLMTDFLSDPYIEIATYYSLNVDGIVTDFPATASSFARSSCTRNTSRFYIEPVQPGLYYAPSPVADPPSLSIEEVVDPPLPAVAKNTSEFASVTSSSNGPSPSQSPSPSPSPGLSNSLRPSITTAEGLMCTVILVLYTVFL